MNYNSAKNILHAYRKTGRIGKKLFEMKKPGAKAVTGRGRKILNLQNQVLGCFGEVIGEQVEQMVS